MKILIFLPNYFGDVLMTTPAIRLLKRTFPESEISVVVKQSCKILVEDNTNINKIIVKASRVQIIREVRKLKPEVVILFRTTFFNSLATFLSGTKYSVGLDEELSRLFLKKVLPKDIKRPYREECMTIVEKMLNEVSRYQGVKVVNNFNKNVEIQNDLQKLDFYGWEKEEIKNSVEQNLVDFGIDKNKKFIVINPVATRKTKMLTSEQYVELIKMLLEKYGENYQLIFVGGEKDKQFVDLVLKNSNNVVARGQSERVNLFSLCGKLNLKELGYLLSISEIFISPDTGTAFIAQSIMKLPQKIIIYYTSTSPEKYGPYPENVKIIYHKLPCSPCYKNECPIPKKYQDRYFRCVSQFFSEMMNFSF